VAVRRNVPVAAGSQFVHRTTVVNGRLFRGFLIAVILGSCSGAAFAGGATTRYEGTVRFGAQMLRLEDGCAFLDGKVSSGDFFDHLNRTDTAGRFEYRKRGKLVTEYPETVRTSIRIVGNQCTSVLSNSPSSIFKGDSYALRFRVEWKDGMQLSPADFDPASVQCVGYSSVVMPAREVTIPSLSCQMTVASKGVPLSNHLIVSVFAADGSWLARLSAAP